MSHRSRGFAVLLAGTLVAGLGALSRAPIPGDHAGSAALRLTWRIRGEEVGACQRPSESELAALPPHMRNPDACVGPIPPFRLTADIGGETVVDETVAPTGARGDRPIYVYREVRVPPGRHFVRVRFVRSDSLPRTASTESGLATLEYEGPVDLEAGKILLLTRGEAGELEVREPVR